jgi:hypothetical protein
VDSRHGCKGAALGAGGKSGLARARRLIRAFLRTPLERHTEVCDICGRCTEHHRASACTRALRLNGERSREVKRYLWMNEQLPRVVPAALAVVSLSSFARPSAVGCLRAHTGRRWLRAKCTPSLGEAAALGPP